MAARDGVATDVPLIWVNQEVRHARPCAGHPRLDHGSTAKTSMAGTSPAMTKKRVRFCGPVNVRPARLRPLQRHDDLAEMLVGFHVLERLADIVEREHLVDRQLQLALLHRRPDVFPDLVKNLADFLDRTGAEGDTDVID